MDVIELTQRLVAIDSVNPALVPGGAGEPEIARFVVAWAEENGLAAEVLEATPRRPSGGVGQREARGGTLQLCAHLDTVGVEGMSDPLGAKPGTLLPSGGLGAKPGSLLPSGGLGAKPGSLLPS